MSRKQLRNDSLVGFLGFFAALSVIQAAINVMRPEPEIWPAVLALVLVVATVLAWKAPRK
ncbi:hypothetical protein [Corynebacterium epidermidicanis]|uniref:Uncharacterized protein n=1 Tax=Corynebacterium epidermidicanis TaxID=1050174 RepID=A0A0G3GPK1_9CORY|nr:hypothetical protein [Corynebacterium epidermidicanis]AKK02515.1 hypothetical protein CEPID_03175 [Corynebacterium epidermidicanis]